MYGRSRYDRELGDIFAVQDEVIRTIVTALGMKLTESEEERRESRGKVDPEAYDLLVRARQRILQFSAEGAREARRMLERVTRHSPDGSAVTREYKVRQTPATFQ